MSIRIMSDVFESESLGPTERLIMLALADHADDEGKCYPSIARLCRRTGLKERAVQNNIRSLAAQGYLTIILGGGRNNSNLYIVSGKPRIKCPPHNMHPASDDTETPHLTTLNPAPDAPKPSETPIEPPKEQEEGAGAKHVDLTLVSKLTHALGFDHHGQTPRYWISPDAALIVARWQTDLGLTSEEILHVATGNMRVHGTPANGPKTLTRHMQDFAAAKDAPRLEPTKGSPYANPGHSSRRQYAGQDQQLSGLAGAAMRRRNARQQGYES